MSRYNRNERRDSRGRGSFDTGRNKNKFRSSLQASIDSTGYDNENEFNPRDVESTGRIQRSQSNDRGRRRHEGHDNYHRSGSDRFDYQRDHTRGHRRSSSRDSTKYHERHRYKSPSLSTSKHFEDRSHRHPKDETYKTQNAIGFKSSLAASINKTTTNEVDEAQRRKEIAEKTRAKLEATKKRHEEEKLRELEKKQNPVGSNIETKEIDEKSKRVAEYFQKLDLEDKELEKNKPARSTFKSSLLASATAEPNKPSLNESRKVDNSKSSVANVRITEEKRKAANDRLRARFEERKKAHDDQKRLERQDSGGHVSKESRSQAYYAELDAHDRDLESKKKSFKSSLLSSIDTNQSNNVNSSNNSLSRVETDVLKKKKSIYTVEQLIEMNTSELKKRFPKDLPDMTIIIDSSNPTRAKPPRRRSSRKSPGREEDHRRGKRQLDSKMSSRDSSRDRRDRRDKRRGGNNYNANDKRRGRRTHKLQEPEFDGPVKPLEISENRWKPTASGGEKKSSIESCLKKAKGVLNKLTRERFEKLTNQLCEMEMKSLEMLRKFTTVIMDKALEEPNFADVYADLCKRLHEQNSQWSFLYAVEAIKEECFYFTALDPDQFNCVHGGPFKTRQDIVTHVMNRKEFSPTEKAGTPSNFKLFKIDQELLITFQSDVMKDKFFYVVRNINELSQDEPLVGRFPNETEALRAGIKSTSFKRLLLTRCQHEFEKENRYSIDSSTIDSSEDETTRKIKEQASIRKAKQQMLGNIRFIGELFKIDVLTGSVVQRCILKLLGLKLVTVDGKVAAQSVRIPDEEDLEALCKFLSTVGKKFDQDSVQNLMDAVIVRIVEITQMKSHFSSRIRFLLQDVLELRDYQWEPRHQELQQKTLDDIRKEAEKLQRQGKNAQHATLQTVRRRAGKSYQQLAKDKSNLIVHVTEEKMSTIPTIPANDEKSVNIPEDSSTQNKIDYDPDKMSGRIKNTIQEYISIVDLDEAVACVKELPKSVHSQLVEEAFNIALEGKENCRDKASMLLSGLYEHHVLATKDIEAGLIALIEFLEDIQIDIPLIHQYSALVFARLIAVGCFGISWILESCSHLIESGLVARILVETLSILESECDLETVCSMITDQEIDFLLFLPSKQRNSEGLEQFIEENELNIYINDKDEDDDSSFDGLEEENLIESGLNDFDSKFMIKIQDTLEEYYSIDDVKEICQCIEEWPENTISGFIEFSFNYTLERSSKHFIKLTTLYQVMLKRQLMTMEQFMLGLSATLQLFDDLKIDIPQIDQYGAQILSPLVIKQNVSMEWLIRLIQPMMSTLNGVSFFIAIFQDFEKQTGKDQLIQYLKEDHIVLENCLPSNITLSSNQEEILKRWFETI